MPSKNRDTKHMTTAPRSVFNEQAALASLAKVKSPEDVKREQFQACVTFIQMAREKGLSWDNIAGAVFEYGGPKLTGIEVSKFFQEDGRVDPSPRASRKAIKAKPGSALAASPAMLVKQAQQDGDV